MTAQEIVDELKRLGVTFPDGEPTVFNHVRFEGGYANFLCFEELIGRKKWRFDRFVNWRLGDLPGCQIYCVNSPSTLTATIYLNPTCEGLEFGDQPFSPAGF